LKGYSIGILIVTFFVFVFYQTQKSAEFQVLEIISPTQIVVDLNNNNISNENETILLNNLESFSTKSSAAQAKLARQLKISSEDALGLGFLTQNFVKETLEGEKIKVKDSQIFINNKNYEKLLLERGFALENGKSPSKELIKNIEKVQKLHLVIFNNKSHKYHKLDCKYGLMAHNFQILPVSQVSKDSKPCKFCFNKNRKEERRKWKERKKNNDYIPDIKSPPVVFQTNSIKIFLTDMTRVLKPSNSCSTAVCKALVKEINSAQNSIDFAIYGYTKIPALQKALENAQNRGVRVRFIYDSDENNFNIYPDTNYLAKILPNNNHDRDSKLMHDKFFIFDNKTVLAGSANISNTDMSGFNSNAIVLINSEKLANVYEQEFEQMYEGRFHKAKSKIKDKEDGEISVYFSPKDKGLNDVITLVDGAQNYIYIPAFLITHKSLTDSLINASKRGVAVKIILDATNTHSGSHSKMDLLRQAGIPVKTEIFAGKLHSKSIIIDDKCTIIGSMNFSKSGEGVNDENLIIIKNHDIAVFYKTFFQYLWKRIPDYWLTHNAMAESPVSVGSCSDGIDNDFDGKIDKADDSCKPIKFH
jgi:sugar-specific transcriptional regulator TrmB